MKEFIKLQEQLPMEKIPYKSKPVDWNPNEAQDVQYFQKIAQKVQNQLQQEQNIAIVNANKSHISGSSFKQSLDAALKKALQFLESQINIKELDTEISLELSLQVLDHLQLCDPNNAKHVTLLQLIIKILTTEPDPPEFTASALLNIISLLVALPMKNSENEQIQSFFSENQVLLQKLKPISDELQMLTQYAFSKRHECKKDIVEEEIQSEFEYKPKINNKEEMIEKQHLKLLDDLNNYKVQDSGKTINTIYDRLISYQKLKLAKVELKRKQLAQQEIATLKPGPQINKFDESLYSSVKRSVSDKDKSKPQENQHYMKKIVKPTLHQSTDQSDLQYCTFHPKIGHYYPEVFKPADMPKNANKFVQRVQKGYQDGLKVKQQLDTMGHFDEQKYLLQNSALTEAEIKSDARIRNPRIKECRKLLKQSQITVGRYKATVKFFVGDTVLGHFYTLQTLYKLRKDEGDLTLRELEKAFGQFVATEQSGAKTDVKFNPLGVPKVWAEEKNVVQEQHHEQFDPLKESLKYSKGDELNREQQVKQRTEEYASQLVVKRIEEKDQKQKQAKDAEYDPIFGVQKPVVQHQLQNQLHQLQQEERVAKSVKMDNFASVQHMDLHVSAAKEQVQGSMVHSKVDEDDPFFV